jgi:hypothetical protein
MMHFQQVAGATIGETLEKDGLPQRTGAVSNGVIAICSAVASMSAKVAPSGSRTRRT